VSKTASFWLVAALAAVIPAQAAAQQPQAVDPAHVRSLLQQAQQQIGAQGAQGPGELFVTPGARVDLGIEEAVQRGLEKNIDIGVARITPRLTDYTLAGLEANYRLNLTSAVNNISNTQFPTQTIQGITQNTTTSTQNWSAGFAQNLFRGGGNYTVNWNNRRLYSPSNVNIRNPQISSGITASLTQPLLRGFRIDATRAALQTNRISQENDEISLRSTMASTQAGVRNAYWDLIYAIQAVEAAQNSFDLAAKLVQDNQSRVEIGTLAPIDVVSAQAEQATRRQTLVQAQATVRTAELALKRLIVSGTDDPLWTASINPTDRPGTAPEVINLEAALTRALTERTDLQQSMNTLRISDINLRNQADQTRPQLNLNAVYGLNGIGGTFIQRSGIVDPITGGTSTVSQTIPSGYFDALRGIGKLDAPTWTVGLNLAYPLGRSAQEATLARSKLSLAQTQAQLKALELQIATDVTNAALTVQSSLESVQASAAARELAQKRLEAAQSKYEVGMATNFEVVQAQRDNADAQNNELRAILNYRKALVNFESVQTIGNRGVTSTVGGGATTTTTGTQTGTTGIGTGGTGTGGTGTGGFGGLGGLGGGGGQQ
jgi:outer membrane protein TolC